MRATGTVRRLDHLGRIVLPIDLRRALNIDKDDSIEIYVDGEDVIIKKYEPRCVFCGGHNNLADFKGRLVCQECRTTVADAFDSAAG